MEAIYVVLIINLIIWTGIFGYVFKMDREVAELKRRMEQS